MKYSKFRYWLISQGVCIEKARGGGSHRKLSINGKSSIFPDHGSKEMPETVEKENNQGFGPLIPIFFHREVLMFNYPIRLEYDKETAVYVASCRDLPLFNSVGDSVDEALLESVDGLITAISIEIDERRPIPNASAVEDGEYVLSLPILVTMKAALHNAMTETGTRKADLARRLGQKGPQIDRLLDVEHSSKVETVELALHQLDRKLDIAVHVVQ